MRSLLIEALRASYLLTSNGKDEIIQCRYKIHLKEACFLSRQWGDPQTSSSVVIPERLDSGLRIDTPLLLKPEKSVLYLTGRLSDKRERGGEYPTLLDIYPFDSTQYSPLVEELEQGTTKLLAMVQCSIIDIKQPEVKFLGHLIHLSTSKKTPLSLSVLNKYQEKNTQIYLIELAIGELMPGKYSLYLIAEEMNTKLKSHTSITFIIRY